MKATVSRPSEIQLPLPFKKGSVFVFRSRFSAYSLYTDGNEMQILMHPEAVLLTSFLTTNRTHTYWISFLRKTEFNQFKQQILWLFNQLSLKSLFSFAWFCDQACFSKVLCNCLPAESTGHATPRSAQSFITCRSSPLGESIDNRESGNGAPCFCRALAR